MTKNLPTITQKILWDKSKQTTNLPKISETENLFRQYWLLYFYRTRVRSLVMLVSDSLTNSLTHSCLVDLLAVNDTNCLMMSQQPLKAVKSFLRLKKLCKLSTVCQLPSDFLG